MNNSKYLRTDEEIKEWYKCYLILDSTITSLDDNGMKPLHDEAFVKELNGFVDIHATMFVNYVKNVKYVTKSHCGQRFPDFIVMLYREYNDAIEYRESRPDLYD